MIRKIYKEKEKYGDKNHLRDFEEVGKECNWKREVS